MKILGTGAFFILLIYFCATDLRKEPTNKLISAHHYTMTWESSGEDSSEHFEVKYADENGTIWSGNLNKAEFDSLTKKIYR